MIKLVKAIYEVKPQACYFEDIGVVLVFFEYNGRRYIGDAALHHEDKDFYSKKVGYNIALSKARQEVLKDEYIRELNKLNEKKNFYNEVLGFGSKEASDIDPTGSFKKNLVRSQRRVSDIAEVLKNERKYLQKYLEGHAKAIASVKKLRNKDKND